MAASTVGFGLGSIVQQIARKVLTDTIPAVANVAIAVGLTAMIATLPGFLHWLILRRWFPRAGWWVLASGVGSLLGFVVMVWGLGVADTQGGGNFEHFAIPVASMALAGVVVGTLQWVVLRRWVARAGWWVPVSGISWMVAEYAYLEITQAGDVQLLWGAIVSGTLSGAITGVTLVGLLRNSGSCVAEVQSDKAKRLPS
jgi:hypothetical protein